MRITSELISRAPTFFNPLKERELSLRGSKIAVIENLGATQDAFDCIDFSDNEITKLDGFPTFQRLKTLMLCNNRIAKIGNSLGEFLPNMDTLILSNNKLNNLSDIDPLADIPSLRRLSLLDNMVTKRKYYRLYVIHKCPGLKLLDFRKIKQSERIAAEKLFGGDKGTKLKEDMKSKEEKEEVTTKPSSSALSAEEQKAIQTAIMNATSMEEVLTLEKKLASGQPLNLKQ